MMVCNKHFADYTKQINILYILHINDALHQVLIKLNEVYFMSAAVLKLHQKLQKWNKMKILSFSLVEMALIYIIMQPIEFFEEHPSCFHTYFHRDMV